MEENLLPIELDIQEDSIIKVMGVGGGGCNAVNFLQRTGVEGVRFLVCNTDRQALQRSPITTRLQLGPGLGAGGRPERAEQFANESREAIKEALSDGTEMLFITAGMGGGTGTGASPIVAEVAQELGILTVAIVTIPFQFEGAKIIRKALRGVARLAEHVDAILVINNQQLRYIYPDFDLPNAFAKSDEVVSNAAKAIAEIITVPGYINTDFQDVYNTLKDGGVAIMNVGRSSDTELRVTKAIENALNSPLVNTNDVRGASRILLTFYCSTDHAIRMEELDQINEFIDRVGDEVEVKWGASYDDSLGEEVRVTVIATGYQVNNIPGIEAIQEPEPEKKPADVKKPSVEEVMKTYYHSQAETTVATAAAVVADAETVTEPVVDTAEAGEDTENSVLTSSEDAPVEVPQTPAEVLEDAETPAEVLEDAETPAEVLEAETPVEEPATQQSADETSAQEVILDMEASNPTIDQMGYDDDEPAVQIIPNENHDNELLFTFDLDDDSFQQVDDIPAWMRKH
ncbi:MAG: cell division protein FtsZ [Paludibacteraceae bacterium]|nr:cell division protein FtsZ [Paludibacteraceae bacterium]